MKVSNCVERMSVSFFREQVDELLQRKETQKILPFLQDNMEIIKFDNDLMIVWYLGMIAQKEAEAGTLCVFQKENSMEALLARYHQLKFYLRRIENDILDDASDFYAFLAEHAVSEHELIGIIDNSVYYKEKVWAYFRN